MDLSVQPDASLVRYVEVGLIRSYRDIRPIADATYLIGRVLIWIWPTLVDYQSFQHLATSTFIAMTLDGRYLRLLTCPLRSSLQHAERSFSVFLVVVVAQRDKSRERPCHCLALRDLGSTGGIASLNVCQTHSRTLTSFANGIPYIVPIRLVKSKVGKSSASCAI